VTKSSPELCRIAKAAGHKKAREAGPPGLLRSDFGGL
jgi:hypothetical protein